MNSFSNIFLLHFKQKNWHHDIQHHDTQHNDTQHIKINCDTQDHVMPSVAF